MRSREPLFPQLVCGGWKAAYPGWGHQGLSTGWGRHQQPASSAPPAFQGAWRAGRGCLLGTEGRGHPTPSGVAPTLSSCTSAPDFLCLGVVCLPLYIPRGSLPCRAWRLLWVPLPCPGLALSLTPVPSPPGSGLCLPRAVSQAPDFSAFLSRHLRVLLSVSAVSASPVSLPPSLPISACVSCPFPAPSPLSLLPISVSRYLGFASPSPRPLPGVAR